MFFYKAVDAQISFIKDDQGNVSQLILHQGGQDKLAKKIEGIKPYDKQRDHAFISQIMTEYWPGDARLYPDLDSQPLIVIIPAATEKERQGLLDAFKMLKVPESAFLEQHKQDSISFKVDKQLIYLYYADNKPVGFVRSFITGGVTGSVVNIAVLPEYRGKGIGGKLLNHLILKLKELGVQRLTLQTDPDNKAAQRMYEKVGFIRMKTLAYEVFFMYEISKSNRKNSACEGIKPYDKQRDHAFISQQMAEHWPETGKLYPDLDAESFVVTLSVPEEERAEFFEHFERLHIPAAQSAEGITLNIDKQLIYVYCIDDKPIGFIRVFVLGGSGKIAFLAVLPDYRGKGIGTKLLAHAISELKQLGIKHISVDMEKETKRFYEKAGFVEIETPPGKAPVFIYKD